MIVSEISAEQRISDHISRNFWHSSEADLCTGTDYGGFMKKTTVKIDGMMCGMCEAHVNQAVRQAFSVKKVTSSHRKNQTVVLSESGLDLKNLRQVIESLGYDVRNISEEDMEKKKWLAW